MHYADLSPYRVGDYTSASTKNIGWLDKEHLFNTGNVRSSLVEKLFELTLLDLDQKYDPTAMRETHPRGIIIHRMHSGGSAFGCPFCDSRIIKIRPSNELLTKTEMTLGLNEMVIPATAPGFFYCFPTLLYHYVTEHHYLPPTEFLDSLEKFSMDQAFDCQV